MLCDRSVSYHNKRDTGRRGKMSNAVGVYWAKYLQFEGLSCKWRTHPLKRGKSIKMSLLYDNVSVWQFLMISFLGKIKHWNISSHTIITYSFNLTALPMNSQSLGKSMFYGYLITCSLKSQCSSCIGGLWDIVPRVLSEVTVARGHHFQLK